MSQIRVFIADDHAIVRRGLVSLIADTEDLTCVGQAAGGEEVIAALEDVECDILVLDLSVARSAEQMIPRLLARASAPRIIILSVVADPVVIERLLAQGVSAYVTKDADPEAILDAIRAAAQSERGVPSGQPVAPASDTREPHERLSPREWDIFERVLAHRSPGEIAAELDLTSSTVSTLLGRIRTKLGARTLTDLVDYAHRVGLEPNAGHRRRR